MARFPCDECSERTLQVEQYQLAQHLTEHAMPGSNAILKNKDPRPALISHIKKHRLPPDTPLMLDVLREATVEALRGR